MEAPSSLMTSLGQVDTQSQPVQCLILRLQRESSRQPWQQPVTFGEGGVHGTPLANKSIEYSSFLSLEVWLFALRYLLGHRLPLYVVVSFKFLSDMCVFYKASLVIGSHMAFQKPFSQLSLILFPPLFSSTFNPPILVSSSLSNIIFYFPSLEDVLFPLVPYELPNLCSYSD